MADDFAISVGTTDRVLAAQIRQVFNNNIINDLEPSDIGALPTPIAISAVATVQPSVSGTAFTASYSTGITGTASRFLTQLTTSNRVQLVTSNGARHDGGVLTAVASNTSATMTNFRSSSDTASVLIPLDTGSPTTGTTIITQQSNTAFTIPSGSYFLMTSAGLLGSYAMTLTDSNFAMSFTYNLAYFNWAVSTSSGGELNTGVTLIPAAGLTSGSVYYLTSDGFLRYFP